MEWFWKRFRRGKGSWYPEDSPVGTAPGVFVSYSRDDSSALSRVLEFLRSEGMSSSAFFVDQTAISGATKFPKVLSQAILDCKVVLFLVSRTSVRSRWVNNEVFFALQKGRAVLPVFLEKVELPHDLDLQLGAIHQIHLYAGDRQEQHRALLRSLIALGVEVLSPTPPAAAGPAPPIASPASPSSGSTRSESPAIPRLGSLRLEAFEIAEERPRLGIPRISQQGIANEPAAAKPTVATPTPTLGEVRIEPQTSE